MKKYLLRDQKQELQTKSFLAINKIVNSCNCEFRRTEPDNAGIDAEIELTYNRTYIGKILKCQIKAGTSYISSENKERIVVKIEKKYLDLWNRMNIPVILFYFKNDSEPIYWKSIKDYILINKSILRKQSSTITIIFDKEKDIFDSNFPNIFNLIVDGEFKYDKYIFSRADTELLISNWFNVVELPKFIFKCPTTYKKKFQITNQLKQRYSFILKDNSIFTFSNIKNEKCELRNYCNPEDAKSLNIEEVKPIYFTELLNSTLVINALIKGLNVKGDKFYMLPGLEEESEFHFLPLKRTKESSRVKVYSSKLGSGGYEYKHHAMKMRFLRLGEQLMFELEPDWHFSYSIKDKTEKEIGIRVTREKANMFNKDYLYILHAMKQFLSNSTNKIGFLCDELDDSQKIVIDTENIYGHSDFKIFNDYSEPRIENREHEN